jgi:hypothetical protein
MKGMLYYWWVPSTFLFYAVYSWFSVKSNQTGEIKWAYIAYALGALCPFWIVVARYSKNLIFDGLLYDNMILGGFLVTTTALGVGIGFSTHNWVGVGLVVAGFILMKL